MTRIKINKRKLRKLLMTWGKVFCAASIVVCLIWVVMLLVDEKKVDDLNEEMQVMFESGKSAATETPAPTAEATKAVVAAETPAPTETPEPTVTANAKLTKKKNDAGEKATNAPTEEPSPVPTALPEATNVSAEQWRNVPTASSEVTAKLTRKPLMDSTASPEATSASAEQWRNVPTALPAETNAPTEKPMSVPTAVPEGAEQSTPKPMFLPTAEPTSVPTPIPPQPKNDARFEPLYERNSDIVGWLWIGEDLSLPIVQRDNEYYLTHDFDRNYREAGTLFMDESNEIWPQDDNLIIYGHNMNNGTMFGCLNQYRHVWFLQQNPVIELQLIYESEPSLYAICAVSSCSVEEGTENYFPVRQYIFLNASEKAKYIRDVKERSVMKIDIDMNADDKLVTLVTCSYYEDDGRLMVTARKLRDGETQQDIAAIMHTAERTAQ